MRIIKKKIGTNSRLLSLVVIVLIIFSAVFLNKIEHRFLRIRAVRLNVADDQLFELIIAELTFGRLIDEGEVNFAFLKAFLPLQSDLVKIVTCQGLFCRDAVGRVEAEHPLEQIYASSICCGIFVLEILWLARFEQFEVLARHFIMLYKLHVFFLGSANHLEDFS